MWGADEGNFARHFGFSTVIQEKNFLPFYFTDFKIFVQTLSPFLCMCVCFWYFLLMVSPMPSAQPYILSKTEMCGMTNSRLAGKGLPVEAVRPNRRLHHAHHIFDGAHRKKTNWRCQDVKGGKTIVTDLSSLFWGFIFQEEKINTLSAVHHWVALLIIFFSVGRFHDWWTEVTVLCQLVLSPHSELRSHFKKRLFLPSAVSH